MRFLLKKFSLAPPPGKLDQEKPLPSFTLKSLFLGALPNSSLTLRLFGNPLTWPGRPALADFVEVDFPGYKAVKLLPTDFEIVDSGCVVFTGKKLVWTLTKNINPVRLAGFYLVAAVDGEKFLLDYRVFNGLYWIHQQRETAVVDLTFTAWSITGLN